MDRTESSVATEPRIHVLWSKAAPTGRIERGEERWCFGCRARHHGTYSLYAEPPGSYYDPFWKYECDGCGRDRRYFPGCQPW